MNRVIAVWLLALTVMALVASALSAQGTRATPRVVSGTDLGFRIDGTDTKGQPTGTFVLRMNGEWVPVSSSVKPAPALTR